MAPFRDRLNAARRLPNVQLIKAVEECISEETSRLYRLMVYVATEFTQRAEKTDISAAIAPLLEKFVEVDENGSLALAPIARARAEETMQAVAQTIMGRLETCDLDMEFLLENFQDWPWCQHCREDYVRADHKKPGCAVLKSACMTFLCHT